MIQLASYLPRQQLRTGNGNRLWLRIGGLLVFVIALVLVLISFLNYSNYRKTCLELNLTRYLVLAKDVRQTIEGGLNIGLRPEANSHLLPELSELMLHDPGIAYIGVINESGRLIGVGALPKLAPEQWQARLARAAPDVHWQSSDKAMFAIGLPFMNNFNVKAGAVVIGYDRAPIEQASSRVLVDVGFGVLLVLILTGLLTLGAVHRLTRRFSRDVVEVSAALERLTDAEQPPVIATDRLDPEVRSDINEFMALSHTLALQLRAAEQP